MNKADIEATGIAHEHEAAHGGGVFTFSERVAYLKKFGRHSMAFTALQPQMRYLTW